ncbi:hypothetical protein SLS53_008719 [Cytospora paraplurivora]|uniref:PD-(D/E)XK nuclease-like domain-containing protein n=1 Tax=Cytospora paraplurivora TaxID=2898453 RepID=A0AAN9YB09_9PEZI
MGDLGPKKQKTTEVNYFLLLKKPVSLTDVRHLPPDVEELCSSIEDVHFFNGFVPADVRHEFCAWLKYMGAKVSAVQEGWFTRSPTICRVARDSQASWRRERALEEMGTLLDIMHEATESFNLRRHEAAWNSGVHHPLLTLAFRHRDRNYGMSLDTGETDGEGDPRD